MLTDQIFTAAFHSSPIAQCLLAPTPELNILGVNDAFLRTSSRRREELEGLPLFQAFPPGPGEDGESGPQSVARSIRTAIETGEPQLMPMQHYPIEIHKDGRSWFEDMYWSATNTPVYGPDGELVCISHTTIDITTEVRAQQALIASQEAALRAQAQSEQIAERLRLATDAANLGIWVWDTKTDTTTWENNRLYEMFGIPKTGEPVNNARFLAEFIHPDDVLPYQQAVAKALETGERFYYEGRFYRASDRALRWFEFTGLLHFDDQGKAWRMVGTAADVTERKESHEKVRRANARLEATLDAAEIGTWLLDLREDKVYADANMARLYGVSAADANGGPAAAYFNMIHPDDLGAVKARLAHSLATGEPFQAVYRVCPPDGECRTIHARARVEFDDKGQPLWLPSVALDITRTREIESALRASQERFTTLLTSMDEGYCVLQVQFDEHGQPKDYLFEEANPAFELQTGLKDVIGKTIKQLDPEIEPFWIETYGRVASTGEAVRFAHEAGSVGRWFSVYATRIGEPGQAHVGVLFRDITAQNKAQEELRRLAADLSRANQRQSEFLATLAHELRNPLAPIRTGLDLMRLSPGNAQSAEKIRAMMERQIDHLVHLVDDLLDLARIQSGKIQLKKARVALKDVVLSAVETALPLIQEKHHDFSVHMPPEPIWLDADAHRLAQVISNLLTNAAKYTPTEGTITLSVARDGPSALITVADNGIGIPADALPHLFEMFNQSRHGMDYAQGGLGIGLHLVKRLTEKHGGRVSAASAGVGRGSTFTLQLPIVEHAPAGTANQEHADRTSGQRETLRILVADDNQDAADSLAELLRVEGHVVYVAHDGNTALDLAEKFLPHLALLDIGMPGMNGHELASAIRQRPALNRMVLVAITGWGSQEDRDKSRIAGFKLHLTKPVDLDTIHRLITDIET
jgi:PAS domain S-box-containing protein